MAEVIGTNKLKHHNIEIISRGILVSFPAKANEMAREVVKKYNLSLENHKAKAFEIEEVHEGTLVLTMTEEHKKMLTAYYPYLNKQVYTLHEFVGKKGNVKDPFGLSYPVYEQCFLQLEELIDQTIEKLEEK
jgi:protein-tyrosine phosphatase